jgi:6-phosphogluconolactonase (cycloisomerase 2 family)
MCLSLVLAASALAAVGGLTQKPGTAGCVSETGTAGACTDGTVLDSASSVTISPDGSSAYVTSTGASDAVAIFDRNPATGALTQKAGTAGCISETGSAGACTDGDALENPNSVAISPDGTSAYAATTASDAVTIFDRNPATGALTQKAGTAGCISETGTAGACTDGASLDGAFSVTISPDGTNVYMASIVSDAVAIFDRNTTTGALTQKAGTVGCISETGTAGACVDGTGLDSAFSVTISPDGTSVYVAAANPSNAVTIFDRDPTTGALTQKAGTAGCITETGDAGACTDGTALNEPSSVTISPDGANVYVASEFSDSVTIFDRNTTTGALTQKAGTAGCISETGTAGACTDGAALDSAFSVTISPDGATAYVASIVSDAVAIFDRNPATGALTQKAGTAGCISETGTAGACTDGTALDGAQSVEIAPDGANVYAASTQSDAVAIFDRDIPPQTTIDSGPTGTTNDNTPTFTFSSSEVGSTFECKVDGGSFDTCSGPGDAHTAFALADGPHQIQVRATDPASNPDPSPATQTFTVDATAPETTIDSGPTGTTSDNTPAFTFSSSEVGSTFECKVDGGTFAACSGPGGSNTTAGLSDGPHTFAVRAIDPAANADPSPATQTFTVDTTPPDTTITKKPKAKLKTKGKTANAKVTFSSEAGVTFECRLDEADFEPCSSPFSVKAKSKGGKGKKHTISVRATDEVGNVESAPATAKFTVIKKG